MAPSVSLSTRVSPDLRQRLVAAAQARGVTLARLTADLLATGVDDGAVSPGDGGVLNEIDCLFYGLPPEAGLHREICRSLARTVESGGGGQVAAAKELLDLASWAQRRFEHEDDDDPEDDLVGPADADPVAVVVDGEVTSGGNGASPDRW
jgi:hypothetical protein